MKKKRLLLIADADSFWMMRLLKYLLLPQGYEVVIFPIWKYTGKYAAFYRENGVTVYVDRHTLPIVRHIPRVRMWARILLNARELMKMGPFDVVQNCYLSQRDLALGDLIVRKFKAHWIASFLGSDLLRSSAPALRRMKPYLDRCHAISVHNQLNADKIREIYGDQAAAKTHLIYFGQTGYDDIDQMRAQASREACRRSLGIDPDRFVICAGYSASSAQQQLELVRAVSRLPEDKLRRVSLVLQQTYCEDDPAYTRQTREEAAKLPCQTVVLTDFMGPEESARLRISADVFLLAIKTDAFSASMQEYLYAGACVIKGSWLVYPQLADMGISLSEFSSFDEVPALLCAAMEGTLHGLNAAQRDLFPRLYSWNAVRESWLNMYPSVN